MHYSQTQVHLSDRASSRIKLETKNSHKALEATDCMRLLMSNSLTVTQYYQILQRWDVWLSVHYKQITSSLGDLTLPDITKRDRYQALQLDLSDLEGNKDTLKASTLNSISLSGITCRSPSTALGCLYVLEGSTLGAAVITRHLQNHFGHSYPHRFYSGYGMQTPRMWKTFSQHFDMHLQDETQQIEACEGAEAVFRSLTQMFSEKALT